MPIQSTMRALIIFWNGAELCTLIFSFRFLWKAFNSRYSTRFMISWTGKTQFLLQKQNLALDHAFLIRQLAECPGAFRYGSALEILLWLGFCSRDHLVWRKSRSFPPHCGHFLLWFWSSTPCCLWAGDNCWMAIVHRCGEHMPPHNGTSGSFWNQSFAQKWTRFFRQETMRPECFLDSKTDPTLFRAELLVQLFSAR